jgi:hypothetical protein
MAFTPDAPPSLKFVPDTPKALATSPPSTGISDVAKGVGDAALSGASKVSTGMVGGALGFVNRLIAAASGGDPEMASQVTKEYVNQHFGHDTTTPVGQAIGNATSSALAPVGNLVQGAGDLIERGGEKIGIPRNWTHSQLSEAGELANIIPMGGALKAGARASTEAAELAAQNAPAAVTKYGMRTLADHPMAAGAAGPSGVQAVALHNQPLGNTVLGAEAGVRPGTALVPGENGSLAQARAAPGSVYDRLQASLPTAPLSPAATRMVQGAGTTENVLTAPSAATQATIDAQKAKLLQGPLTGPQVVQTSRALRQEGGARLGSDDVEQQNLGAAQLAMARGLEQHIADTLPENAPTTLDQFQAARTALAKNYAVQGAVKGGNVDMQAIARMQQRDPDLLTGPLKDIADFANQHPAVTRLTNGIEVPPSFSNDLGQALRSGGMPQDILGRIFGASGISAGARRILTGNPADAQALARQTPVSGLGGEFGPVAPRQPAPLALQPPQGQAFTPHQPQAATGNPQRDFFGTGADNFTASPPTGAPPPVAGAPGQIPLADVLSHGVEQPPPQGLSSGPMGAPAQTGIPFQQNASFASGPLSLADDLAGPATQNTYGGKPADNRDVAPVMSANVPNDIAARAAQTRVLKPEDFVNNNASGESSASLEDQNTPKSNLVQYGPDDVPKAIMKSAGQKDVNPDPHHIIIDTDKNQIVKSGNMAPALARGLFNRWQALHGTPLGSAYE